MTEQHVFTPAAVSDDVKPPQHPRERERQLMLAVAITASLPRVLWGLTIDATHLLDTNTGDLGALFSVLRYGGLAIDIGCLVLIGMLASLDKIVPGTNGKRVAVIALGGLELCLTFLPLASIAYGMLGSFGYLAFSIPSLAASLAFAVWLAALLKPAGKATMLIPILIGAAVVQTLGHIVFGSVPLLSTVVGVLIAVEVLRARRVVETA
jgi:hypothetical protein